MLRRSIVGLWLSASIILPASGYETFDENGLKKALRKAFPREAECSILKTGPSCRFNKGNVAISADYRLPNQFTGNIPLTEDVFVFRLAWNDKFDGRKEQADFDYAEDIAVKFMQEFGFKQDQVFSCIVAVLKGTTLERKSSMTKNDRFKMSCDNGFLSKSEVDIMLFPNNDF